MKLVIENSKPEVFKYDLSNAVQPDNEYELMSIRDNIAARISEDCPELDENMCLSVFGG